MGFFAITSILLILLQALVYFSFVRYLKTTRFYKPAFRFYALIPFLVFNVPLYVIVFVIGRNFNPPQWFKIVGMTPFYIWHAATFLIAVWLLIGKVIKLPFKLSTWLLKLIRPVKQKIENLKSRRTVQAVDFSRRKFVRTATFAFSTYAFAGAAYGVLGHDNYTIEYKDIKIDNLPPELIGTTITLISDLHAGQYMTESDMRKYAEIVNELDSDIICIPGDFVNFQVEDTKYVAKAFKDLKARYGIYGSLGNHDFFMNPDYVADVITNESPIMLLRNSFHKLNIKGKDLYILGVDDTRDSGVKMNRVVLDYLEGTIKKAQAENPAFYSLPKILLCHKPYGFDDLAQKNMDLVLAGHTHGGQVVPFKFGTFNVSFAAAVSKYIEGLYRIGKSSMYVSRGLGTVGLPVRINCPPEITRITIA
jgi:predicted MPP superfamily phosphohydrolase